MYGYLANTAQVVYYPGLAVCVVVRLGIIDAPGILSAPLWHALQTHL
jgi:hypothetical protein